MCYSEVMTTTASNSKPCPRTTDCKSCTKPIHYGGEFLGWVHDDSNSMFCNPKTQRGGVADQGVWCPVCGEFGKAEASDTPWGIRTDCACGYHNYYSIGD
jgi:hypothetical protein